MSMQVFTTNHAFSVFGFLGFISMIILLPMHSRAKNVCVCLYIVWTSICCLVFSVNSVVWDHNVENWAPVWCDISSRVLLSSTAGYQVGLLCITRRLYRIITMTAVNQSSHQIRCDTIVELSTGIGFPLLLLLFQYIVEYERFAIVENIGCFPAVITTPPYLPLYAIWTPVFGLATFLYAGLAIRAGLKRKAYRREVMQSDQHLKSSSHYWRFLALSAIGITCSVPFGLTSIIYIVTVESSEISPYSWNSVHSNLSQIIQYPVSEWVSNSMSEFELESNRWFPAFYALTFFAFFGFTKDARIHYRLSCLWIIRCMGFRPPLQESPDARKPSLPAHHVLRRHASCPPVVSGTPVGSLRFISYITSSQVIGSITQSSHIRRLSLPTFSPSLSIGQPWRSHAGELSGGSFTLPPNGETIGSIGRELALSADHNEQGETSLSAITEPAPVLAASVVLRRGSSELDSTIPVPIQALTTSIV